MRVLLVEDDPMIGKAVQGAMRNAGCSVDWARTGSAAELAIGTDVYDAIVLDLGLPGKGGLEILKSARNGGNETPVVIATARDAIEDRITGLNLGADDYIVKPYDLRELIARLHAVLRRRTGQGNPALTCGKITLDPRTREITLDGATVSVRPREFAILEALMRKPGAVVSRDALANSIYEWGEEIESNSIEVHLHHLRKKIGAKTIINVRGVGYRLSES